MPTWKDRPARQNAWERKSKKQRKQYGQAAKALYGEADTDAEDADAVKPKAKAKAKAEYPEKPKNNTPLEKDEQAIVVVHCDKQGYPYYAVPNASRRTMWEAMQAKRQGMKAGVLDLCFTWPAHGYHGFYLEMKRQEGGIVSPVQHYWIALLRECGYKAEVAEGAQAAIKLIDAYFNGWKGISADTKQMLQDISDAKRNRKQ